MGENESNHHFNESNENHNTNTTKKYYPNNQKEQLLLKLTNKYGLSYEEAEKVYLKIEKKIAEKKSSSPKINKQIANENGQNLEVMNKNNYKQTSEELTFQKNNNDESNVIIQQNILDNKKKTPQNNNNIPDEKVNFKISDNNTSRVNKINHNKSNNIVTNHEINEQTDIPNEVFEDKFKYENKFKSDPTSSSNSVSKINKVKSLKNKLDDFFDKFNPTNAAVSNGDTVHSYENNLNSKNTNITDFSNQKREIIDKEEKNPNNNVDSIISDIIPNYNQQVSIELNHVNLTFEDLQEKIDTLKEDFIRTVKRDKGNKEKFQALKDITFKIYKGEKVGIIGYNGAGKSTLLNVISGIYSPDNGSVKTHGKISPLLSLGAGFDFNYTGRDNILLNGAVLGYDKEFIENKVDEIIEFSELNEFIDVPVKNYSNGMIAKLGFSIATIVDPDILIIDEILGVGDVNFRKKSSDKIRSLMDGGTTVLLVSHSIGEIRSLCDKAIWIDKGHVREIGEVNKVCDHYLKDAEKASNEQLKNITLR